MHSLQELNARWKQICTPGKRHGKVCVLALRPSSGAREYPETITLDEVQGVLGDRWYAGLKAGKHPQQYFNSQVTVMSYPIAALLAGGQQAGLSGDNIYVDLDLSTENAPPRTRLHLGEEAILELNDEPHNGCALFAQRFGKDAMRWVAEKSSRHENRRGLHARVVKGGIVGIGDAAVLSV